MGTSISPTSTSASSISPTTTTTGSPTSSIQGLASNIQWQNLIDAVIQSDTANTLMPVKNKVSSDNAAIAARTQYGQLASALNASMMNLANGSAFTALAVTGGTSPTSGAALVTASATSSAAPGNYGVQVLSLASAQQLSGNIVSDPTAAINVSGQIVVGGQVVTIASTDSLNSIRDKINALDTGTNPTHVSASVLMTGSSAARLVLTSDVGGSSGIDIRDARASASSSSLLAQLGFISGSTANVGSDGAVRSANFSSTSTTIGAQLSGVTGLPGATTILVNGQQVSVNLQTQSLTDIAAAINAKSPNSASVQTITNGTATTYQLKVSGSVAASADTASAPALDLLGLTRGATAIVQQEVGTSNVLLGSDGSTATSTTQLAGLNVAGGNGAAGGAQAGDTFTITGTKPDGTAVSLTETVSTSNTVGDMLNDLSNAFSVTGRHVTAAIVGGKIQLSDDTGGDSGLNFSIAANNESGVSNPATGASLSFGATTVDVTGRQRQLSAGTDARVVVNGVALTRPTNTISDAITGVTLNLQRAEPGTTVNINVAQDTSGATSALQQLVTAYNNMASFVSSSTTSGGALQFNTALRQSMQTIKDTLLGNVSGLPAGSPYNNAALVGLTFDDTGTLSLDTDALNTALSTNPASVKSLFSTMGAVSNSDFSYVNSSESSANGSYSVNVTRAATTASTKSTALNFIYAAGGATDTMTISDSTSGKSGSITLSTGDTPASVAQKLNALFAQQNMRLAATSTNGQLAIASLSYGSTPSFAVTYQSSADDDVGGMLGITAGSINNGLDVQGNFMSADGATMYAASGSGQVLTGTTGPTNGIAVSYTGAATSATSTLTFSNGISGTLSTLADELSRSGDGIVAQQSAMLQQDVANLTNQEGDIQARLDATRATMTAQFTAMESAMSTLQTQSAALTNQINSLLTPASLQSSGG